MTRSDRPDTKPARSPGAAAQVSVPSAGLAGSDACRFVLAADHAAPGLARARLRRWLEGAGWPDEELEDIEYAVSEAVSNSAEHAYPAGQGGEVVVEAFIETLPDRTRRVRAVVRDRGRWRPEPADPLYRRRGIFLISQFMDEATVRPDVAGGGTEVVLTSAAVAVPAVDGSSRRAQRTHTADD